MAGKAKRTPRQRGTGKRGTIPIRLTTRLAREVADWLHHPPPPPTALHDTEDEQRRLKRLAGQFAKAGSRKRGMQEFELRISRNDAARVIFLAGTFSMQTFGGWRYSHRPRTPPAARRVALLCLLATGKRRGNPKFQRLTPDQRQHRLNGRFNDESWINRLLSRERRHARIAEETCQGKKTVLG